MIRRILWTTLAIAAGCATPQHRTRPTPALEGVAITGVAQDPAGHEVQLGGPGAVRVIDFFASWCEPCQKQLPALDRLAKAYAGQVEFRAVSFDVTRPALDAFLQDHGVGFPVLWAPGGEGLATPLGVARLPTTVVVDRAGVVRWVHEGYQHSDAERLKTQLDELLAE
ncbi:MAG: TlpA disulfide reductase family protein [Anaeromyxobacter sp.]